MPAVISPEKSEGRSTRPASDSAAWRDRSGDALPGIKNCSGCSTRSARTRKTGKMPGCLYASSMTTGPSSAVIGLPINSPIQAIEDLRLATGFGLKASCAWMSSEIRVPGQKQARWQSRQ